ncbi:hypothetical protein LguiA_019753 [Lonicera macranthoides]
MKSSLGKLRKFALHKGDSKEKKDHQASAHLDELAHASQDMQEMRNCYDSLLSAAAATANSAYEFSESLQEMGTCLQEKTSFNDDGESGRLLLMLGQVQLELQKLVDSYRSHVILTITNPSESLLSELRKVETKLGEMRVIVGTSQKTINEVFEEKREVCKFSNMRGKGFKTLSPSVLVGHLITMPALPHYYDSVAVQIILIGFSLFTGAGDETAIEVYEYMVAQHKEKGKSRSGKLESFTPQQLQEARDEYDEVARLCVFRVKSLKQGQCRSLLTQAARHHTAQGIKSLEAVEPSIRLIAQKHHIDYQLSGLDDGEDGEGESVNSYETSDAGELSFDYRQNKQGLDNVGKSRMSMELDRVDVPYAQASKSEEAEINFRKNQGDLIFGRQPRAGSHSAPIYPEKFDPADRIKEMQPSARKFHTYVLPTPVDSKSSASKASSFLPQSTHTNTITEKQERDFTDDNLSASVVSKAQPISNNSSTQLPPPLSEGHSLSPRDTHNPFDTKKNKRQAFSGPLASKPWSSKPFLSASGPITSTEPPQLVSRSASPPPVSSPKISELHELPRPPPGGLASKSTSSGAIGHSAPLGFRNQEVSPTKRNPPLALPSAFTLPVPPLTVPRSFSIPSSNQRAMAVHVAKLLESPQIPDKADVVSPPLTPISLSNMMSLSSVSEVTSNSGQIRGGGS